MSILSALQYITDNVTASGFLAFAFLIMSLVEITPVKISPLTWLGRRLNKETNQQLIDLSLQVVKLDHKLDEHVAESYRNNILTIQDKLLKGEKFTKEEWKKALKSCQAYTKYVTENNIQNGLVEEAMLYIHRKYQAALDSGDFIDVDFTFGGTN